MQSDFLSQPATSMINQMFRRFQMLTRRYALFHTIFLLLFIVELLTLLIFMPFFAKTLELAILMAMTFLTIFTYFVLRFYLQTRKPEQLMALRDRFLSDVDILVQKVIQQPTWSLHHIRLVYQFLQKIEGQESQYYIFPSFLKTLSPLVEKFSAWFHWEDVHWMKETLHTQVIQKIFNWIKLYPTDLELHKTLASACIAFYQIYQLHTEATYPFIARQYQLPDMKERFEKAAYFAIEELKVVLDYKEDDHWALNQSARVYHDLGLKDEERQTYEKLLILQPEDRDIYYQLGKLYFEMGCMAQGLKLYQELQKYQDPKAEELIQYYDIYHHLELFKNP